MNSSSLIEILKQLVLQKNTEKYEKLLEIAINNDNIKYDSSLKILIKILNFMCDLKYEQFIKSFFIITEKIIKEYKYSDKYIFIDLVSNNELQIETIKEYIKYNEINVYELLKSIIFLEGETKRTINSFFRLYEIENISLSGYYLLLEDAYEFKTSGIIDILENKIKNINDYSNKPDYILEIDDVEIKRKNAILSIDKIDDLELFRLFGPKNGLVPIYNDNSICFSTGGCRMHTCNHISNENDDDDVFDTYTPIVNNDYDWFSFNCDYCLKKIKNKEYCIRKPKITGGWEGCYCSIECLKNELNYYNGKIDNLDDEDSDNQYSELFISVIIDEMKKNKIYSKK